MARGSVIFQKDTWRVVSWPLPDVPPLPPSKPVPAEPVVLPKPSRRRSTFGRLSSWIIPSLNFSFADSPKGAILRKPVAAEFPVYPEHAPNGTAAPFTQPYPQPDDLPPGLGLYSSAQVPRGAPPGHHRAVPHHHHHQQQQQQQGQPAANNSAIFHRPRPDTAPQPPPKDPRSVPPVPAVKAVNPAPLTLKKSQKPQQRRRSSSLQQQDVSSKASNRLQPRRAQSPESRGRSVSAHPPSSRPSQQSKPRVSSNPHTPRPQSAHSSDGGASERGGKLRRSWLPGGRSRANSQDMSQLAKNSVAWILMPDSCPDYNISYLANGEKVGAACVGNHLGVAEQSR
jgi:hypothetical protein